MTFKRIPRKKKKQIPKGLYCYKGLRYDLNTGIYYIKTCNFYTNIKNKEKPLDKQTEWEKKYPEKYVGWCKLIKCEIEDQCKSCGINKEF